MLMTGNQITQPGDQLRKIEIQQLFQAISNPKQEYQDMLQQLHLLSTLDKNQYASLKKKLPYFVCGIFHPPYRKKENFSAIDYFIIDIDHIVSSGRNIELLTTRLQSNDEVRMMFRSPSGDGIKVMFKLNNTCKDSSLYTAFYKIFSMKFAEQYEIVDIVDFKTNDVTRACFLSFDPNAHLNTASVPVVMSDYVKNLSYDFAEIVLKETDIKIKEYGVNSIKTVAPDQDILLAIRQKLNPGNLIKTKDYIVPGQIEKAVPLIKEELYKYNMELIEATAISYGNKLKIKAEHLWAEINIFYGKRGFSVIKTTRTGSNDGLADLAVRCVQDIINQHYFQ